MEERDPGWTISNRIAILCMVLDKVTITSYKDTIEKYLMRDVHALMEIE